MWKLPNRGDYIDFLKGVMGGGETGSAQPDLELVGYIFPPQHLPQCWDPTPALYCSCCLQQSLEEAAVWIEEQRLSLGPCY